MRLHRVSVKQHNNEEIAPLLPKDSTIEDNEKWFDTLLGGPYSNKANKKSKKTSPNLRKVLQFDAFKKEGLKELCSACGIEEPEDLPAKDMYIKVLKEVIQRGTFQNVQFSAIEGFHRMAALVITLLRSSIDKNEGIITPDSLQVEQIKNSLRIDDSRKLISDEDLRTAYTDAFFDEKRDPILAAEPFTVKIHYANKPKLRASDVELYLKRVSRAISDNKKESVTRCPFNNVGDILADFMMNVDENAVTYRADFSGPEYLYPTHAPHKTSQVEKAINDSQHEPTGKIHGYNTMKKVYEYNGKILDNPVYKDFIENPLSEENFSKVKTLITPKCFVPHDKVQEESNIPENLSFPFYPSFKSMSEDVGKEFGNRSRLNPYIANNLIMAPMVYTILYAAKQKKSVQDVLSDDRRKKSLHYFLRFHINASHKPSVLEIHGAYEHIYKLNQSQMPRYISDPDTVVLGATQLILTMYMAVLAINTEPSSSIPWTERRKSLQEASTCFRNAFSLIGTTAAGRDIDGMLSLFGKFKLNCQIFYMMKKKLKRGQKGFCVYAPFS